MGMVKTLTALVMDWGIGPSSIGHGGLDANVPTKITSLKQGVLDA